jgi:hypothetical protein
MNTNVMVLAAIFGLVIAALLVFNSRTWAGVAPGLEAQGGRAIISFCRHRRFCRRSAARALFDALSAQSEIFPQAAYPAKAAAARAVFKQWGLGGPFFCHTRS